jgi:2-polyprenyl-3-methyl-5-hydroxy-6-metoxy-1,4-benzoquinol methylase
MEKEEECTVCSQLCAIKYNHHEADIYKCNKCNHCFSILKDGIYENYSNEYFTDIHKNWFMNPNLDLFKLLSSIIEKDDSSIEVMDVGCGNLDFIKYLRNRHQYINIGGVDLSEQNSTAGINFIKADFVSYQDFKQYDYVFSIMTIEHIDNINQFTQKLYSIVKPGGYLIITTINQSSILYMVSLLLRKFRFVGPFERLYSKHHLNHFSSLSLKKLIELNKFKIKSSIYHNVPLNSLDIPANNFISGKILIFLVFLMFKLGNLLKRTYAQTIIAKRTI